MKKYLLLYIFCLFECISLAQQQKEKDAFTIYSNTAYTEMDKALRSKNYKKAISIEDDWFFRFNSLSPELKQNFRNYLPNSYYNLACAYSLDGQKVKAIEFFGKAIDSGFIDYAHILTDTDLDNIRNEEEFNKDLQHLREKVDFQYILKISGSYHPNRTEDFPAFTYQSADAPPFVAFKKQYNLDSVSGSGDEISRIKNLLLWSHNIVRHDGNSDNPPSRNAIDLIAVCKKEKRGVNCRMLSTILKDAYLAEGFKARLVTCMPKDTADFDCHVITVVWSVSLNKWIWMDPTFYAFVSDDQGNLLNIEEVRERLIAGKPLVLNKDANWNNESKQTRENYLDYYMSKNLYWLKCSAKSEWDLETKMEGKPANVYINLYLGKYTTIQNSIKLKGDNIEYATNDPAYFWQKPAM